MDETILKLLKAIEDKYSSVKEVSNRLEGFYTVTRVLLEKTLISLKVKYRVLMIILVHMKQKLINLLDELIYWNLM